MKNIIILVLSSTFILFQSCKKDNNALPEPSETVLYQTDFSNDDGHWWVGTNKGATCSIDNGYYVFDNSNTSGVNFSSIDPIFTDINTAIAIESSIKAAGKPGMETGVGGLVWNRNEQDNSDFEFMINSIGKFEISGYPDGKTFTLYKDWVVNSAIKQNDFNTLRIEMRNGKLHFLINGIEVYTMDHINDNTLDRPGIAALNQSIVQADYFKAVQLD